MIDPLELRFYNVKMGGNNEILAQKCPNVIMVIGSPVGGRSNLTQLSRVVFSWSLWTLTEGRKGGGSKIQKLLYVIYERPLNVHPGLNVNFSYSYCLISWLGKYKVLVYNFYLHAISFLWTWKNEWMKIHTWVRNISK